MSLFELGAESSSSELEAGTSSSARRLKAPSRDEGPGRGIGTVVITASSTDELEPTSRCAFSSLAPRARAQSSKLECARRLVGSKLISESLRLLHHVAIRRDRDEHREG